MQKHEKSERCRPRRIFRAQNVARALFFRSGSVPGAVRELRLDLPSLLGRSLGALLALPGAPQVIVLPTPEGPLEPGSIPGGIWGDFGSLLGAPGAPWEAFRVYFGEHFRRFIAIAITIIRPIAMPIAMSHYCGYSCSYCYCNSYSYI